MLKLWKPNCYAGEQHHEDETGRISGGFGVTIENQIEALQRYSSTTTVAGTWARSTWRVDDVKRYMRCGRGTEYLLDRVLPRPSNICGNGRPAGHQITRRVNVRV